MPTSYYIDQKTTVTKFISLELIKDMDNQLYKSKSVLDTISVSSVSWPLP